MKIAVEGCCHGELDIIYETILLIQKKKNIKIDLLLCCGDFQCIRNENDLLYLHCPDKYKKIKDFQKYYTGEKRAPVLTIFVGGNHEASNLLTDLYYGGWVAPNIYYIGCSGVLNYGGLRIAGISGIYKHYDYYRPYELISPNTAKNSDFNKFVSSLYHMRDFEVQKLLQLNGEVDIVISHDWPKGIEKYGDVQKLIRMKPHFEYEIQNNNFGNPATRIILNKLQPKYWFAAHLHVKYPAIIQYDESPHGRSTKFLSLDKVLPKRDFMQIIDIENDVDPKHMTLCYDIQWLAILKASIPFIQIAGNVNNSNLAEFSKSLTYNQDAVDEIQRNLGLLNQINFNSNKCDCDTVESNNSMDEFTPAKSGQNNIYKIPEWFDVNQDWSLRFKSQRMLLLHILGIEHDVWDNSGSPAQYRSEDKTLNELSGNRGILENQFMGSSHLKLCHNRNEKLPVTNNTEDITIDLDF